MPHAELPAFDEIPSFYTAENYSPARSALINGAVVSVWIFIGLYLTMSHWTSHATSSTLLIGSHHQSRSHLFEVQSPSAAPTGLNTEIKVKPERGRPKDVWTQMVWLLSSSPVSSPSQGQPMNQAQASPAARQGSAPAADYGKNSPRSGMTWKSVSEDSPGLWARLQVSVSSFAASLSRPSNSSVRAPAGHPLAAAKSSPQPEEYEEWDDPKGGFPAAYFRVNRVLGTLDTDHDGIISTSEIANAPLALLALDRNHDGILTRDEFGADTDRARTEFMQLNPILAALDADHNGEISANEIQNAPAALKALDRNGDGKLAQDEVLPDPVTNALRLVMMLDQNGDGKISKDERTSQLAGRYRDFLDAADRNQDGVVTQEEVTNELRRRAVLSGIAIR